MNIEDKVAEIMYRFDNQPEFRDGFDLQYNSYIKRIEVPISKGYSIKIEHTMIRNNIMTIYEPHIMMHNPDKLQCWIEDRNGKIIDGVNITNYNDLRNSVKKLLELFERSVMDDCDKVFYDGENLKEVLDFLVSHNIPCTHINYDRVHYTLSEIGLTLIPGNYVVVTKDKVILEKKE